VKRVRFHPDARAELLGAIRFYQNETAGLGRAMAGEVRSALRRISEFPESGSPDGTRDDLRRVFLDRFPFTVVYRIPDDGVEVLAVMHQRQRPDYWRTRIE
jgi:plasmid stabilization system protein ParE